MLTGHTRADELFIALGGMRSFCLDYGTRVLYLFFILPPPCTPPLLIPPRRADNLFQPITNLPVFIICISRDGDAVEVSMLCRQ
jgi:hypothetical protein